MVPVRRCLKFWKHPGRIVPNLSQLANEISLMNEAVKLHLRNERK